MKNAVTICLISTVAFILTLLVILPTTSREYNGQNKDTLRNRPIYTNSYYPQYSKDKNSKSIQKREILTAGLLMLPLAAVGGLAAIGAAPFYAYDKYRERRNRTATVVQPKPLKFTKSLERNFQLRYQKEQKTSGSSTVTSSKSWSLSKLWPWSRKKDSPAPTPVAQPSESPEFNPYSSRERPRSDEMIRQDDCSQLPWYLQEACFEEQDYIKKKRDKLMADYIKYTTEQEHKAYQEYLKQVAAQTDKAQENAEEAVKDQIVKGQQYEDVGRPRWDKFNRFRAAKNLPELPYPDYDTSKSNSKSKPNSKSNSFNQSKDSEEQIHKVTK